MINELKIQHLSTSNFYDDDLLIVFEGVVYHIDTMPEDDSQIPTIISMLQRICTKFHGLKKHFFTENGELHDMLLKNDGYLLYSQLYKLESLPKLLFGEVVSDENGKGLKFFNETTYDILHSKELKDLLKVIGNDFSFFIVNGKSYNISDFTSQKQETDMVRYVYHGTGLKFKENILKKGIRPMPENSQWGIQHDGLVFLTSDLSTAIAYALNFKDDGGGCVFKIDTQKIDPNKIVMDWDNARQYTDDMENYPSQNKSSAESIGNVTSNSKRNGTKYNRFGYNGVIMPNAIVDYYVPNDEGVYKGVNGGDMTEGVNRVDEIAASNINLQSFEIQDELHPKLWVNNKLNSKVRLRLLDIANDFYKSLSIAWVKPKDIILTGSLANYNWSKYSDIDVHIIVDYKDVNKKHPKFVEEYFKSKKDIWNDEHENLTMYGFPVEMYVEDVNTRHKGAGVYSLNKNKWIQEPVDISDSILNQDYIQRLSAKYINEIDEIINKLNKETDNVKIERLGKKMNKIFTKLKGLRKEGLNSKQAEMSSGNIVWKVLRRMGYLDKVWDVINSTYNKINSLK